MIFKAKSKITKERNWYDLYDPYVRVDEAELPEMEEGQILEVEDFRKDEKETQPPNRYSQSGIVNQLEKQDLGTKATRAPQSTGCTTGTISKTSLST